MAKALKPGDVIGIIAPASPARSQERITKSVEYFERLGYRVELGKQVTDMASLPAPSYLAAPDKDRLADLHAMFRNKHVKAIFYHRGGYGSIRLLDKIDYDLVRANPKIIVGYSDATALFAALHKKTGLAACFFGPMPGVDLWDKVDPFTEENFWRAMTTTGSVEHALACSEMPRRSGIPARLPLIQGRLIGGNLTVFCSLLGTPYQPSFRNSIPIFEEIEEKPRKIDAYLAQLRLAGLFDQAKAVLLGYFTNCTDADAPSLSLEEVIDNYFPRGGRPPQLPALPLITGLPFGHEPRMLTLPLGAKVQVKMDKNNAVISILDSPLV